MEVHVLAADEIDVLDVAEVHVLVADEIDVLDVAEVHVLDSGVVARLDVAEVHVLVDPTGGTLVAGEHVSDETCCKLPLAPFTAAYACTDV